MSTLSILTFSIFEVGWILDFVHSGFCPIRAFVRLEFCPIWDFFILRFCPIRNLVFRDFVRKRKKNFTAFLIDGSVGEGEIEKLSYLHRWAS